MGNLILDYNYNLFRQGIANIEKIIVDSEIKYEYIVGIARGGLIPATFLSYRLDVPLLALHWSTRDNPDEELLDEALITKMRTAKKVLIVDDIIDSGLTIKQLKKKLKGVKFDTAALVYNEAQPIVPNYFDLKIDRKTNKEWVDFFWDHP